MVILSGVVLSVQHFGPEQDISATVQIDMKVVNIHGPQRMIPNVEM